MSRRLRILMLDGSRQTLPFLRSFKKAGHHVTSACSTRFIEGYFSRYPDRRLLWPDYYQDPDSYARHMLDYLRKHRPDVTLAADDISARIVAEHKAEVVRYTRVTVPDHDVLLRAVDKAQTMAFCMANGIPCPTTYTTQTHDLDTICSEIRFPVIVKPRIGVGAVGLHRVDTPEELRRNYQAMRGQHGELLIQEFIPQEGGTQFQAEAFLDANSEMKVCMVIAKPRFFPVSGGTSTANLTIDRPDIQDHVRRLLEGIGWTGPADVDLMLDPRDNVPKILEINPRVTAGIKIGFAAGIDYADLHLRLAMGRDIPTVPSYKLGVYSRNLIMDILWYLFSDRQARRATPLPFFHFIGRDVVYQTFGSYDPLPLAGFFLGMVRKYTRPGVWKSKLGRELTS